MFTRGFAVVEIILFAITPESRDQLGHRRFRGLGADRLAGASGNEGGDVGVVSNARFDRAMVTKIDISSVDVDDGLPGCTVQTVLRDATREARHC